MPLDQLASRVNANPKGRFIDLARQVNPDMADYIKKLKLPGIHLRKNLAVTILPAKSPHT
ncbi:hypothetical protein ACNKHO_00655 [Shigella flexneri]